MASNPLRKVAIVCGHIPCKIHNFPQELKGGGTKYFGTAAFFDRFWAKKALATTGRDANGKEKAFPIFFGHCFTEQCFLPEIIGGTPDAWRPKRREPLGEAQPCPK